MENKSETQDEPIYSKINSDIRRRADTYVYESKMLNKNETDNLRKLLEVALDYYMIKNPIIANNA